jgi:succinate dehydrogenase / fumarate reductase cytochrome b subunit
LTVHSDAAFWKVQNELAHPLALAIYVVGIVAASWHFGYGLFLFAAKWGIVTGAKAQKRAQQVGIALSVLLVLVGLYTVYAFVAKFPQQQRDPAWDQQEAPAEQSRMIPSSIPSSPAR